MTKDECQVLADVYEANARFEESNYESDWNYIPYTFRNWETEENPCLWTGVECADGHVTELRIEKLRTFGGTVIPPEIGELTHLTRLNLQASYLESVPQELGKLTNLRSLSLQAKSRDIKGQTPKSFAETIGRLTNLEELSLLLSESAGPTDQYIPELMLYVPTALTGLPLLTKLAIPTDDRIPAEILELNNLTSLGLIGTSQYGTPQGSLTKIPQKIASLPNLTELVLHGNSINALPTEIGTLKKLTTLDLSYNKFSQLPPELSQLPQLRALSLEGNNLSVIPPTIRELTSIESLNVSLNSLDELPPDLAQLANLSDLSVGGNRFRTIPPVVFEVNPVKLGLRQMGLMKLDLKDGQLSRVIELDLSGNPLYVIPIEVARLPNLAKLDLSNTRIFELPEDMSSLAHLEYLNLSGNSFGDANPLDPLLRAPGYQERLNLSGMCDVRSDNPKLQRVISDRHWDCS